MNKSKVTSSPASKQNANGRDIYSLFVLWEESYRKIHLLFFKEKNHVVIILKWHYVYFIGNLVLCGLIVMLFLG